MDEYQRFRALKTFAGLDGIRAICALSVVLYHCQGGGAILPFGYLGVDMFFVISGFLIVTLLLRERDKYGQISLKMFYIRRTLRIFPIYYLLIGLVLLCYLAVSPWKPNGLRFYLNASWVLALYLQDIKVASLGVFFHTWSLAMEEQFYLVWPAMEKFASRIVKLAFLGAMLLLCQASNFGLTDHAVDQFYGSPEGHLRSLFLCTFTPIIFGVILAHLLHGPKTFRVVATLCRWSISIPCLLVVIAVAAELSGGNLRGLLRLIVHACRATIRMASATIRMANFWEGSFSSLFARI